ncbi:MAG: PEGA domain-containing protein [Balneolaceae bacterium]|nr:PEGA domain-containing protein [Balneolaceae bacterium]
MKYLLLLGLICVFGASSNTRAQEADQNPQMGGFTILSNIEEFILLIDDDLSNPIYYIAGDTIQVPVGERSFRGVLEGYHDTQFDAIVSANQVNGQQINFLRPKNVDPRSSYQTFMNGYNVSVYSEEGAEIFINQEFIGYTQVNVLLNEGEHELFINHPEYGTIFAKIDAAIDNPKDEHRYFNDYRNTPKIARFVPGLGYIMDGKNKSALLTISGLATLIYYQGYASAKAETITNERNLYQSRNLSTGPIHENRLKQYEEDIKKFKRRRTFSIIGAGVLYVATTYKTLQRPKEGYKKPPVQFNVQAFNRFGEVAPQFNLTVNF